MRVVRNISTVSSTATGGLGNKYFWKIDLKITVQILKHKKMWNKIGKKLKTG